MNHFQHAVTGAGAQIEHLTAGVGAGVGHRRHMALGQIHHMDIIPDTGAIGGIVIVAENAEFLPAAHSHLGDKGHQIIGNTPGIFTDAAAFMGADGIEIPQKAHAPIGICYAQRLQDLLGHVLGPAIGIGATAGGTGFL